MRPSSRRCGHCKNLKPELNKAARSLKGVVRFGNVDATVHRDLAVRFGVSGYPTMFHISEEGEVRSVNGVRTEASIKAYVRREWKRDEPMPYWTSPMGPIATTQANVMRFGMWLVSFDAAIEEATGIPKVGVQFAFVLIGLMLASVAVMGVAYATSTQHKPQFRPYFHRPTAPGRGGGRREHED